MDAEGRRIKKRSFIIIALVFLLSVVLMGSQALAPLERKSIDLRLRLWRQGLAPEVPMALVLVDDASLEAMAPLTGRWPWPRGVHGQLIDFLALAGAKAVVVDLLFSEIQTGVHPRAGALSDDDRRLSAATTLAGNVYHALQLIRREAEPDSMDVARAPLSDDLKHRFGKQIRGDGGAEYQEAYPPFAELCDGARGLGVVSFNADADGIFRRERLLFSHGGSHYPALGLTAALDLLEVAALDSQRDALVLETAKGHRRSIPLGPDQRYHINPYGRFDTFSYSGVFLSAYHFLNGQLDKMPIDPARFADRVVFIGTSAGGIGDLKATALNTRTPGVYLHAALTANVMAEDYLCFLPLWGDAAMGLLLLSLTTMAVMRRSTYLQKVLVPLLLAGGYIGLALLAARIDLMLNLWDPLATMAGGFIVAMTMLSFSDGRERRRIRRILGQYVSPTVLSSVLNHPSGDLLKAEVGSEEHLTLFFSDLRGFTAITEQYPVQTVVQALNAYLSRMVSIIFTQGGTLDKFIGDAIMAFWGAPLPDQYQHHRAVSAALEMQAAMAALNNDGSNRGYPQLRMGIGIHSGDVILGNIGSTKKLDYTVIGDSVNFTARLESLTKFYQAGILISEATHRHVGADFCCRAVDRVCVQGKTEPIQIYEVLDFADTKNEALRHLARLSTEGFGRYRERDFGGALELYDRLRQLYPQDQVGRLFTTRCKDYLNSPPPATWRGEFVCQNK
jgi:adenylate cyclase